MCFLSEERSVAELAAWVEFPLYSLEESGNSLANSNDEIIREHNLCEDG